MANVRIEGAEQLGALGKRLRGADKELRKQLLAAIRATAKPLTADMAASAGKTLPQRGGLGRRVAKTKLATRTKLSGREIGVRVVAEAKPELDLAKLDAGKLRHKTFGHRPWVLQNVRAGAFSNPFEAGAPKVQSAISAAMDQVARQIDGGA